MASRMTTQVMIERFKKVHGDEYDYSLVDSDNRDSDGKVKIGCKIHGYFLQTPTNHLRTRGCFKCYGTCKKTTEDVINDIKDIYGDRYVIPNDFEYVGNKSKFKMICREHGEWLTTYNRLVIGKHGCKKCTCNIYTDDTFKDKLKDIYGDTFDYSHTSFNGFRSKVKVKCNNCGEYSYVMPSVILKGNFKCNCDGNNNMSQMENEMKCLLEKNDIEFISQYKAEWLRMKEPMSIDFYLPNERIAIECQGRMHFEPFIKNDEKSLENLEKQKQRDEMKLKLCEEHGIKMLYYSNVIHDGKYIGEIHDKAEEIINIIKLNNIK